MGESVVTSRKFGSEAARLASFADAIDAIRRDIEGVVGEEDLRYVRRMRRFSRAMEVLGRGCIHFGLDPVSFGVGVFALFVHKQIEATEIGHSALHGAWDCFGRETGFYATEFRWLAPVDEASWRHSHNVKHHGFANVAGKDPDIHFGPVRLTAHTPFNWSSALQVPFMAGVLFPNFAFLVNVHVTGVNDCWFGNLRGGMDQLPDRAWKTMAHAHYKALRKYVPYYAKEYVLFPLLGGPLFGKVLLGNWMSEVMRDVYSAATIFCGHVGDDVAAFSEGSRFTGRGAWYASQVEASHDFEVSWPVSVLCGALDKQIEHHLFPKLPPERLREVAPRVRAACEAHGVRYRTGSWASTLGKAFRWVAELSRPSGGARQREEEARVVRSVAAARA